MFIPSYEASYTFIQLLCTIVATVAVWQFFARLGEFMSPMPKDDDFCDYEPRYHSRRQRQ